MRQKNGKTNFYHKIAHIVIPSDFGFNYFVNYLHLTFLSQNGYYELFNILSKIELFVRTNRYWKSVFPTSIDR